MSRAYDKYTEDTEGNENLAIEVALKVGLLVECEFHDASYYDSCAAIIEEDVEIEINKILNIYKISDNRKKTILDLVKNIQNMYQDECVVCNRHNL